MGESYIGVIDYMKMWRDHNLPDSAALPALYINGKEPMNYGKSISSSALRLCVRLFDDGCIQFLGMNQVFLLAFWAIEGVVSQNIKYKIQELYCILYFASKM